MSKEDLNPFDSASKASPNETSACNTPSTSRRQFLLATASLAGVTLAGSTKAMSAVSALSRDDSSSSKRMPNLAQPIFNRAPLAPTPFAALPLGSIRAQGWLLTQLTLQRDGLTGHAEELLDATGPNSAWKGGTGEDWEKGPYYLKGLVVLAYTLDDAALKAKAQAWIEPILASQQADGFFGPTKNNDWWPRMVATYLLRDYAEATGDERVAPFLTRYYHHMSENVPTRPLTRWSRARAGDEIDTIFWLYNRTGESFLLPLADTLHQQAYPWREIFSNNRFMENGSDNMTSHNVNVPQAMKMPAVYFQRSKWEADKAAYAQGAAHLKRDHGTSFGIQNGSEMLSGRSSFEAVETCSIVEQLLSDETALRILGDPQIGDAIEFLAFNALPATLSKNSHQHVYYTIANNVAAKRGGLGYDNDHVDGRTPAPRSGYGCCCYNLHMGWPKLAQNAWAATPDGGLAALYYLPSQVNATMGGTAISLDCQTNYPFEETITLRVSLPKQTSFPLRLRIPAWCKNPHISVNGKAQKGVKAGTFALIERRWKNGDEVTLRFPMTPTSEKVAAGALDSVALRRGPLLFCLPLQETWTPFAENKLPGFESYEVTSQSPWNFALKLDGADAIQTLQKPLSGNPFETGKSPITLQVNAQQIDSWQLQPSGLAALEPPPSPVAPNTPTQQLELVPFGSQMLRITNFPVVGPPATPLRSFEDNFQTGHPDAWIFYGGGWVVRDGVLHPDQRRGWGHAVAHRAVFSDFTYQARITLSAAGNAGLTFRVNQPRIGTNAFSGYYVGLSAEKDEVILGRADGTWQPIAAAPLTMEVGQTMLLRVEARGPQIRVWVSDNEQNFAAPLLDVRDEAFTSGAIGVRYASLKSNMARAAFSAVRVNSL